MNWSAAPVALVPPGVVTVTSTAPPLPAGDVAVIEVALLTVNDGRRGAAEGHRRRAGEVGAGDGDRWCRRPSGREFGLTPVTVGAGVT